MTENTYLISISKDRSVTAIENSTANESSEWLIIYAPGAGSNVHDAFGAFLCRRLAENRIASVRFQFLYTEAGLRRPDPPRVAESTWRTVIDTLRPMHGKMVVGGRPYRGRIASRVVSSGAEVDALALFAYPLRPPNPSSEVRDGHFPEINVPTLFVSGTRDSFGTIDELRISASKVAGSTFHVLDGADHGFGTSKSSGRTKECTYRLATLGYLCPYMRCAEVRYRPSTLPMSCFDSRISSHRSPIIVALWGTLLMLKSVG